MSGDIIIDIKLLEYKIFFISLKNMKTIREHILKRRFCLSRSMRLRLQIPILALMFTDFAWNLEAVFISAGFVNALREVSKIIKL